uniref:Actin n=1 Tax=Florenciella parvula TaxID=236787 RepID=A0A7S2FFM8_9STRA
MLRRGGYNLTTSAEREIVRSIKEDSCYVAFNPEKEEGRLGPPVDYRLPDGEIIKLGAERFQAPEALFRPELIGSECPGVHECLYYSLMKSDRDLRTVLYKQIVLAGGSTMYQGYGDRLLNEVRKLSPEATKITISAPPQRKYSTWVGGSILASLATFNSMWVTREDYQEKGASCLKDTLL